jgi:hypothetical protein
VAEAAAPVESVWVCCHICGKMCGNPAIVVHEPQCYSRWCAREYCKPPSRRLPPPERPELVDGEPLEAYNERAQKASERCSLYPCPKCGRRFDPERFQAHVRGCEENLQLDVEEAYKWGPVTSVGEGWSLDELLRFCHRRRQQGGKEQYRRAAKRVGERVPVSGAVKLDRWDVNGMSKRELIARINANLAGERNDPTAEDAIELATFKRWLSGYFVAKPKLASRIFSARLVYRDHSDHK